MLKRYFYEHKAKSNENKIFVIKTYIKITLF